MAIDRLGPIAAIGKVHVPEQVECRVVRAEKLLSARSRGVGGFFAGPSDADNFACSVGTVQITVGIHRLAEHPPWYSRGELLGSIRFEIQPVNLAAGAGRIGLSLGADGDRFGVINATNVDDSLEIVSSHRFLQTNGTAPQRSWNVRSGNG